jgi:hypothetical protein
VTIGIELGLTICVAPDHARTAILHAVTRLLGNGTLPDGSLALFHPDRFTFGQTVYLAPVYAAVQSVDGVIDVTVTRFSRLGDPDPGPLQRGMLTLSRLEIASLDNDPNAPERGLLTIDMRGGQ